MIGTAGAGRDPAAAAIPLVDRLFGVAVDRSFW